MTHKVLGLGGGGFCCFLPFALHCLFIYVWFSTAADDRSFLGLLVEHIYQQLCVEDEVIEGQDWMLTEALDSRKLQSSGTFQNCLARKIDDVIIPIFSELIEFMDTCSNFDLLHRKENTPLGRFWLEVFGCRQLMNSFKVGGKYLPSRDSKCKLPFSWLISEVVGSFWDQARSISGMCYMCAPLVNTTSKL